MKSPGSTSTNKVSDPAPTDALQLLYQRGDLSSSQLKTLKKFMKTWGVSPLTAILDTHVISEEALADKMAQHLRLERVRDVRAQKIPLTVLQAVPFQAARTLCCMPVEWSQSKGHLKLVVADPTCSRIKRALEVNLGSDEDDVQIALAIGERKDILSAIDLLYPLSLQLDETRWDCGR